MKIRDIVTNTDKLRENTVGFMTGEENTVYEVVRNPNIQGGRPTIKGTRWPVHDLADLVNVDGLESTIKSFRGLPRDMAEYAVAYAKENSREADGDDYGDDDEIIGSMNEIPV